MSFLLQNEMLKNKKKSLFSVRKTKTEMKFGRAVSGKSI